MNILNFPSHVSLLEYSFTLQHSLTDLSCKHSLMLSHQDIQILLLFMSQQERLMDVYRDYCAILFSLFEYTLHAPWCVIAASPERAHNSFPRDTAIWGDSEEKGERRFRFRHHFVCDEGWLHDRYVSGLVISQRHQLLLLFVDKLTATLHPVLRCSWPLMCFVLFLLCCILTLIIHILQWNLPKIDNADVFLSIFVWQISTLYCCRFQHFVHVLLVRI